MAGYQDKAKCFKLCAYDTRVKAWLLNVISKTAAKPATELLWPIKLILFLE